MSKVKRVYVEKKPDYAVKAKELHEEIKNYLGIKAEYVRVLVRYDIENISDETYAKALETVFAEPPVDVIYEGEPELAATDKVFSVEALPGQFDQRADSAEQCVKLLAEDEEPVIKTATTYVLSGDVTDEQMKAVMDYCVNPVDSRICGMEIPETLVTEFPEPADVHIFDGFKDMAEADLKELYDSLGLAMTFKDFLHIQNYFKGEEKRDPSMTEIRVHHKLRNGGERHVRSTQQEPCGRRSHRGVERDQSRIRKVGKETHNPCCTKQIRGRRKTL